jgi:hypothetical protein
VYVKEAHPLDEWQMDSNEEQGVCYRQPVTLEERLAIARDFVRRCDYEVPLAVDRLDDAANAAYAGWPERLYVIDEHKQVAYKGATGPFGYHTEEVAAWLMQRFPPRELSAVDEARVLREPLRVVALEAQDGRPLWRMEIAPDGEVRVAVGKQPEAVRRDGAVLADARRRLVEAGFFRWDEASGSPSVDGVARSVRVDVGDASAIVHAYVATDDGEAADRRFEELWRWLRSMATPARPAGS